MKIYAMSRYVILLIVTAALGLGVAHGEPEAYPDTVRVGHPGNVGDTTGYGEVPYVYRIGKYEVTNAEYCEFLNAVKPTQLNKLWRWQMERKANGGITRTGDATNYTFVVKEGMQRNPAVLMNWYETLRFCNWLSNGKGEGSIDTGPYSFDDQWGSLTIGMPNHATLAAGNKTQWVLASENEWYKAAYFDPDKKGGPGYWVYPGRGKKPPEANLGSEQLKAVGSYKKSPGPYGTFDQGGNVWEWNEARQNGNCGVRGGSYWYNDSAHYMSSRARYVSNPPEFVYDNYGFRVVALGGKFEK
jgi:formylglycine-generating enzyme required for sulfatase activity